MRLVSLGRKSGDTVLLGIRCEADAIIPISHILKINNKNIEVHHLRKDRKYFKQIESLYYQNLILRFCFFIITLDIFLFLRGLNLWGKLYFFLK